MNRVAVLNRLNAPVDIETVEHAYVPEGYVGVNITCTGICGAQLQDIAGEKGNEQYLPHCLGHEACGFTDDGRKVIVHWRKGAGAGRPGIKYRGNGGLVNAGPVHTFGERVVVSENRVTEVPDDFPDELGCLLGCCLSTAICTMEHVAKAQSGESVAVIGCGGVGLSCIKAARMAHAGIVHAWDKSEAKRTLALNAGAEVWGCLRCHDVIIDTTGANLETALKYIAPSGRIILVGQGIQVVTIDRSIFSGEGITIQATQAGGFRPEQDIPRFVEMWREGKLDADGLISHRLGLDYINEGIDLMRSGRAARVLIYP